MDWTPCPPCPRPARQDLPTYPFQRQTYWLHAPAATGSPASHGQAEAGHPILTAAIDQPDGTILYTGRVSAATHPWTGDHAIAGTVLLPGTAFVDLAAHAGSRGGTPHIAELAIEAPWSSAPVRPSRPSRPSSHPWGRTAPGPSSSTPGLTRTFLDPACHRPAQLGPGPGFVPRPDHLATSGRRTGRHH